MAVFAFGVALLMAGTLRANPQDAAEGTPLKLKMSRQVQPSDYNTGSLTTHVLPAKNQNRAKARELQKPGAPHPRAIPRQELERFRFTLGI